MGNKYTDIIDNINIDKILDVWVGAKSAKCLNPEELSAYLAYETDTLYMANKGLEAPSITEYFCNYGLYKKRLKMEEEMSERLEGLTDEEVLSELKKMLQECFNEN